VVCLDQATDVTANFRARDQDGAGAGTDSDAFQRSSLGSDGRHSQHQHEQSDLDH